MPINLPYINNDPRFDYSSDPFDPKNFVEDYQRLEELKHIFEKYDPLQLISTISGFQLYPINHTHILRLTVASRVATSCQCIGSKKLNREKTKKILNRFLPIKSCFGKNEDPPEYPFTYNIQFYGGNYVVYTGIYPIECFIIQTILEVLCLKKELFPEGFFSIIYSAALGILNISNQIAERNGHKRYKTSENDQGKPIRIPPKKLFQSLSNSVIFTYEQLNELATSRGFFIESLFDFSLPNGHSFFSESNPDKNPLICFPIIHCNSGYIIAAPTSLIATLRKFILITAEKFKCKDTLLKEYNEAVISKNKQWLSKLGYQDINLPLQIWDNQQKITEWSSKIDKNKVAHTFFVSQESSQISGRDFYEYWEIQDKIDLIKNRIEQIKSIICQNHTIVIFYIVINNFTNWYKFNPKIIDNISCIILNYDDLFFISNLPDLDELSLFKYSITENNPNTPELLAWSFIDKFAYYLENGCSFYSSDEKRNAIYLWPGHGHDLRKTVYERLDYHLIISIEPNQFIPVKRLYPEETQFALYIPSTSYDNEKIGIQGFTQIIWVIPNSSIKESRDGVYLFNSFSEMISSWIFEIKPYLNNLIPKTENHTPIIIEYSIDQIKTWLEMHLEIEYEKIEREDFKFSIHEKKLKLTIPLKLQPLLLESTNVGERILLFFLIDALIELCNSLSNVEISRDNIQAIVDQFAPYGDKKFLHLISSIDNPFIDVTGIIPPRLIDDACYQIELDNLGLLLKSTNPNAKRFFDETDVNKKIHIIVDIFHNLIIEQISQFTFDSILTYAISQYESILVHRHLYSHTFPAKLNINPINSQTTDIEIKINKKIDRTSHAVRILIEIISAQPPKGETIINNFEYDVILAKIIILLEFAIFSEIEKFNVGSVDLNFLKSGRIGMVSDYSYKWNLFYDEKMVEHISNIILTQQNLHAEPKEENSDQFIKDLNEAFNEEYGYNLSDLMDFTSALYQLVDDTKAYCILSLNEFIRLTIDKSQLNKEKVSLLIENFSLKNRNKWDIPPKGFITLDIYPWIFSRRLSYLIRPLIFNQNENGDILILWGKRQVLYASKHVINLIFSGRYQKFVKGEKINALIGNIRNKYSHQFVINLATLIKTISEFIVDTEIPIGPREKFSNETDIGDIDVLVIDIRNSIIYIIECKDMSFSRTPREINTEIQEFTNPNKNNYLKKHLKRVNWINQNISIVIHHFNIAERKYQIIPLLVISEEIPVPFFKKIDIPFLSFTSIKSIIDDRNVPNKAEAFKQIIRKKQVR